jgi:two-component system chemotaxis sensor kinase CheA
MAEFDRSAFIGKFKEEAHEYLQRLNEGVIALEGDPGNRALIDRMLRDAHTLKGSSRMVGLLEISDIAHGLEDLMVGLRDGRARYTPDLTDGFFDALDAVLFLTEHAGEDASGSIEVPALLDRLHTMTATAEGSAGESATEGGAGESAAEGGDSARAATRALVDDTQLHGREQSTVRVKTEHVDRLLNLVSEVVIAEITADERERERRGIATLAGDANRVWARLRAGIAGLEPAAASALAAQVEAVDSVLAEGRSRLSRLGAAYAEDSTRTSTVVQDLQEHAMALRMLWIVYSRLSSPVPFRPTTMP